MAIDTVLHLAVLPILTGVETGQKCNGVDFILAWLVLVFKALQSMLGKILRTVR